MGPDNYFNQVKEELSQRDMHEPLWLKCYAEARGDDRLAVSLYAKYRTRQLFHEKARLPERLLYAASLLFDYRVKRGRWMIAGGVFAVAFGILLLFQPLLHHKAERACQQMWEKVQEAKLPGKNERALFETLGWPQDSDAEGFARIYLYNPSSRFCLGRSRYELKFFTSNGAISGVQAPMAVEKP